jgi:hypothetical protein
MHALIPSRLIGMLFYLTATADVFGQVSTSVPLTPPVSSSPASSVAQNLSAVQALQQQRMALMQARQSLAAQGATPQQLLAWDQQNAGKFAALLQQTQALAAATPSQPLPTTTDVQIPDGATQQMSDFLTTRADLANRYAQLYNQQLQAGSGNSATANVTTLFQQQNAAEIQAQQQRVQVIAAQAAQQPLTMPPPLSLPPNVSPGLAAFLKARDQLKRDRIALSNQYLTATPAVRAAALQQWDQQNVSRMQQLAQNLSNNTAN